MEWRPLAAVCVFLGETSLSTFATEIIQSPNPNDGWKFVKETGGISFSSRARAGSSLKEFKAVGQIDASSRAVHNVLDDVVAYPDFMPFTKECRIIKREGDAFFAYQRLSPGIVRDRDYTLRISKKSWPAERGIVFLDQWELANTSGPGEKPRIEQPNDVIVRVTSACICGSDLHMYEGRTAAEPGIVFGHENLGIIEEVGGGVTGLEEGDRVVMPFNVACGFCKNCQAGFTGFCLTVNP